MENPYAHSAAPTAATPEQQKLADYETAVGRNVEYYLPKFERYDAGGSTASWHWPAFFVTSAWYLYRKIWLWGILHLFFPIIAAIAIGIVSAILKVPSTITGFLFFGALLLEWILLTVFANAIYWRRVNTIIDRVPRSLADKPDKRTRRIERDGGTSIGAMIGILFGVGFIGIGMTAAIAIPAYQDYTIRSQVVEGLNLAAGAKAAVAEYYAGSGNWPLDAAAAGVLPIQGKYVESVTVANGSVVITYGGLANRNLANKRLILSPGLTDKQDVVWTCGERAVPPEVVASGPGPKGSDLANKYVPTYCRP